MFLWPPIYEPLPPPLLPTAHQRRPCAMASKRLASALKPFSSHLEVERKFNAGPQFASLLSRHTTTPHMTADKVLHERLLQSLKSSAARPKAAALDLGDDTTGPGGVPGGIPLVTAQPAQLLIRDTYYDTADGLLSSLGLWPRQRRTTTRFRQGSSSSSRVRSKADPLGSAPGASRDRWSVIEWNAKLRVGGDYTNSQFVELDGRDVVAREVLRVTAAEADRKKEKTRLEDLSVVADLLTRRSEWTVLVEEEEFANGGRPPAAGKKKMTIVLDDVTEADPAAARRDETRGRPAFAHTIGEVEMSGHVCGIGEDDDDAGHEAYRKTVAAEWTAELETFMRAYPELFPTDPEPVGKLSAYYRWKAGKR
ncbi:hypothetical protein GGR56DRAFT_534769 [Xylariaceae sp. FL0804]|nr:hypothetical protein GGR56DRAFT_534769 [Xylariaceae sp. FL0804]